MRHDAKPPSEMPRAVLRPERRFSWILLLPLAAAVVVVWLGYRGWAQRGTVISVQLDEGHGLVAGADVRYHGIVVGQVQEVALSDDLDVVKVTAVLRPPAGRLARTGARFWVVHPQLDVTGASGLETFVGPRYLAVLPGDGAPRRHFLGLSDAPVVERIEQGDLEIILETPRRGDLRPGTPVRYRQVPIGTVLSVGLASDAGGVEARAHIQKAYTQLIRADTRFWKIGGIEAQLGLKGVTVQVDSIEALLAGGVALATPPIGGDMVRTGHRFALEDKPREEWLTWQPRVSLGNPLLPPGGIMPAPLRAVVGWNEGRWLKSRRSHRGWVLQTTDGLLGPADLLEAPAEVGPESVVLEVAGQPLPLTGRPLWSEHGLALRDVHIGGASWPTEFERRAQKVEDCVAIADSAAAALPLSAARLQPANGSWLIDAAVSVGEDWHGAAVLSRADAYLLGLVIVEDDAARIALLPKRGPKDK